MDDLKHEFERDFSSLPVNDEASNIPMKFTQNTLDARRAGNGFTLVELLVVVLIIVVLAAITFTVTTRVRDQAITATDTGKFRQVSIALNSMAQENNGIIPHGAKANGVPLAGYGIPDTEAVAGEGNRFSFHEVIDRYFPPAPKFNPRSIYNYDLREGPDTIYTSKAAKPWPGYSSTGNRNLPGPLWFSFNGNLNNASRWAGRLTAIPDPSKIVICGETNHMGGGMEQRNAPTFANNVSTRYRVSRMGKTALYLFVDGHVERLQGDRSEAYYSANPGETNIWKWW